MNYVAKRLVIGLLLTLGLGVPGCAPEEEGTPGISTRPRVTPKPSATTLRAPDSFDAAIRQEADPTTPPTPDPLPSWSAPTAPPLPSVIFVSPAPETAESPPAVTGDDVPETDTL